MSLTNAIGGTKITASDRYTYTNGPVVTGLKPSGGPPAGGTSVTITGLQLTSATTVDFGTTPAAGFTETSSTSFTATSPPNSGGTVDVTVTNAKGVSIISTQDQFTYKTPGYWTVASDGGIFSFGAAQFFSRLNGGQAALNAPIVGFADTPTGGGYWEVAADGGIFNFGNAQFYGSWGASTWRSRSSAWPPR